MKESILIDTDPLVTEVLWYVGNEWNMWESTYFIFNELTGYWMIVGSI